MEALCLWRERVPKRQNYSLLKGDKCYGNKKDKAGQGSVNNLHFHNLSNCSVFTSSLKLAHKTTSWVGDYFPAIQGRLALPKLDGGRQNSELAPGSLVQIQDALYYLLLLWLDVWEVGGSLCRGARVGKT